MPKKINEKNVLEALDKLNGNRRNPLDHDSFGCVYTDPKNSERHCIAGQILIDLGWGHKLPAVDHVLNLSSIESLLRSSFTSKQQAQIDEEAWDMLTDLQALADSNTPTWASVRKDFYAKRERRERLGLRKAQDA